MRKFIREIGDALLAVPWFIKWPWHVSRWVQHADHVPFDAREMSNRYAFIGFSILCFWIVNTVIGPEEWLRTFEIFSAVYVGWGTVAVSTAVKLSRKYRGRLPYPLSGLPLQDQRPNF